MGSYRIAPCVANWDPPISETVVEKISLRPRSDPVCRYCCRIGTARRIQILALVSETDHEVKSCIRDAREMTMGRFTGSDDNALKSRE